MRPRCHHGTALSSDWGIGAPYPEHPDAALPSLARRCLGRHDPPPVNRDLPDEIAPDFVPLEAGLPKDCIEFGNRVDVPPGRIAVNPAPSRDAPRCKPVPPRLP